MESGRKFWQFRTLRSCDLILVDKNQLVRFDFGCFQKFTQVNGPQIRGGRGSHWIVPLLSRITLNGRWFEFVNLRWRRRSFAFGWRCPTTHPLERLEGRHRRCALGGGCPICWLAFLSNRALAWLFFFTGIAGVVDLWDVVIVVFWRDSGRRSFYYKAWKKRTVMKCYLKKHLGRPTTRKWQIDLMFTRTDFDEREVWVLWVHRRAAGLQDGDRRKIVVVIIFTDSTALQSFQLVNSISNLLDLWTLVYG